MLTKTVNKMKYILQSYCKFCGINFSENSVLCVKCLGIQRCDLCNGKSNLRFFYYTGTIYCKECEKTNKCKECLFIHDKPSYVISPCAGCW